MVESKARTILLVEDDEAHAELIRRIFEEKSPEWVIYHVSSITDALKWLEENKKELISLILADYVLPDGTGLDLTKGAKSPEDMDVPLIILTGYGSERLAVRSLKSGAMDFVVKSADELQELPWTVERALREWANITERKRADEALRESEQWLSTTLRSIGDAVIATDAQGLVTLMNPVAEGLTGWDDAEAVGKPLEDVFNIINEQTGERAENPVDRVIQEGVVVGLANHTVLIAKDGTKRPIADSGAPIVDEEGNILGIVIVFRDITERRRAEMKLKESSEKLKALDKLKSNFLHVAYHELQSPLAPIVANASLLEPSALTAKQKKSVYIILKSAEQLEKLINRLLEATRIDTGKIRLSLKVVSIPEIVKNMLASLKLLTDAKKQTITIDVPESIEIEGDEQKITAIFDNLISNAIKFTGEIGKIDIQVTDRGEDIVVSIADTGIGILEEHLPRVFERFYMINTSLRRKGGLGMGLSIVKEYVKLHGGKVWATSEYGKGSNFFFTLPKKQKYPAKET